MGGVVEEWVEARTAPNKISAEKLFDLLSRLEMKRLLHRLTLIYKELSLQFLYFLYGKETFT